MASLCVITGTKREAACLVGRPADGAPEVLCSGARTDHARALLKEVLEHGCRGVVSFGLAGGLSSDLKSGMIIVPEEVSDPSGAVWRVTPGVRERFLDALHDNQLQAVGGSLCGSDRPALSPEDKFRLRETTQAIAIDMESHIVAAMASERGLPWLVVRAIADDAGTGLPRLALDAIRQDGAVSARQMAAGILKRPYEIPALITLGRRSAPGLRALRRVAPLFLGGHLF